MDRQHKLRSSHVYVVEGSWTVEPFFVERVSLQYAAKSKLDLVPTQLAGNTTGAFRWGWVMKRKITNAEHHDLDRAKARSDNGAASPHTFPEMS